ncbi:hypothetical protein DFQ27_003224 [Actinomortierella ambigua]|uniref:Uncharacterized protein n=1 Tax=Actinomortierella ambigua TaxID=1343610 RepID=A0A9P6Q8T6_9FUNG|nr:hypothetical protein DFQ27_003224 [Actinomortierella ambigua]
MNEPFHPLQTISPIGGVEENVEQEAAAVDGDEDGDRDRDEEGDDDEEEEEEEEDDDEEDDGIEIEVNSSSRSSISSAYSLSPLMDDMHSPHDSDHFSDEVVDEANLAQLEQMKQEGFRELALHTQQHSDVFIAKMVYWESLSPEEKALWLASQQEQEQQHYQQQHQQQQQQHQQQRSYPTGDLSVQEHQRIAHCDMDELVAALECRATVKDYSALLVYEKRRLAAAAAATSSSPASYGAFQSFKSLNEPTMSNGSSSTSASPTSEDTCSMEF